MCNRPTPIHEIAADISQSRRLRAAVPRSHPLRPIHTSRLGVALFERYMLLEQKDDLDKSTLYLTESLLSSPLSWLAQGPMFARALCHLALSLLVRSKEFRGPEDAISAAKCLRHLRNPVHSPFAFQRQSVTAMLVETLAFQIELKASNVVQTLQEIAVLTHELLTSDPSSDDTTGAITQFSRALAPKFPEPFPEELLNQIIKCLRLARKHKPKLREVHFLLAKCLYLRYYYTLGDELEEAASIVDEMIASSSPGDKFVAECQELVPILAMLRSMADGHPETSEDAIYRARAFLSSSSVGEALYPTWPCVLENAAERRFQNFGPIDSLETPSSSDPLLLPWPVRADHVTQEMRPLEGLLDRVRNNRITDIEEAVELGRSLLASSDPSDLHTPRDFGNILFEAFERTQKIEYLNDYWAFEVFAHPNQDLSRSPFARPA
ncbi:hypothetical protein V8E53_000938 [Lactarius tabidus]